MTRTSEDHLNGVAAELAQRLSEKIAGEVRFDAGSRALYATDLSVYRQVPIGVVIPRDVEDVVEAVSLCRQYQVPILGRGCGTSLAGQCCNVAVVLDFSKHLNHVLAIDPARKTAIVEAGVINDDLRNAAEQYHLTFGPDPATHAYCTLGGNIGNNSCGAHSVMAGRTVDNVEGLEILTYDGLRMQVGATSDLLLAEIVRQGGRRGAIYAALRELRDKYADEIRRRYPKIPRRVSGYNLDELLPENGFNVARALVGSESTCALVLKATVRLVDSPAHRALVVVGFPDIFTAADVSAEIRQTTQPLALEAFSEHVLQNMERQGRHPAANLLPSGGSWLLVEFGGSSSDEAGERARAAAELIRAHVSGHTGMSMTEKREEQEQLWHLRESGVAASRVPGVEDSWPSWEDSAVAPERLGPYLRDLARLIERYGYKWTVFGHFGDGCIHSRIAFDLKTRRGVKRFRSFMFDAADLVVSYGGSLSGEHGDGQARAELLPKMFGHELVRAFAEFKQIWDPSGKMNPNKIVEPHRLDQNLRERGFRRRQPRTYLQFPNDQYSFLSATERCFGVGKCRGLNGGTMCPSFKATRDEMHTTRGRAHLLFEMMRGDAIKGGWRDPHVREALDLCLACKGCKNDCPVSVDIASYKAEFLAHYYRWRLRPADAYAMGLIYKWARLFSLMPRTVNWLSHSARLGQLAKSWTGIAQDRELPRWATESFTQWAIDGVAQHRGRPEVLLWPDTFNNYFSPETAKAAVTVLEAAGYSVKVPRRSVCCRRPLFEYGMLGRARRELREVLFMLRPTIKAKIPIVFLEPSCLSVFRDELANLFPKNQLALQLSRQSFLLTEFLIDQADYQPPRFEMAALVHNHCHHKALIGTDAETKLFQRMGLNARMPDFGCCGLAGPFGYRQDHYEISMRIGEQGLLPAVRNEPPDNLIIANGFSCRTQVAQATGRQALHPAEVLRMAIENEQSRQRPSIGKRRLAARAIPAAVAMTLIAAAGAGYLSSVRITR
jgi:FAD/FMN-containing dehydrogenase/Fe-S oxidoreductase